MPDAMMIVYRSPDGEKDWTMVPPADVPDWVKAPDVMGRLVRGEMARGPINLMLPDEMRPWYRVERINETPVQ